jgi:aryl-alcohol dehydrogenase-like predicted oxidoreductase
MIEKRPLGATGLSVAPLVVGGNVFGWTADEPTSFAILDAFAAAGITTIDTSDVYSAFAGLAGGESETVIGNWMQARRNRDRIQVATKVGLLPIDGAKGLAPKVIAAGVEASLRRLRTDYIDIQFAHVDDETVPQEAVAEAFDTLVRAGKVRVIGASNFSQARLASALDAAERNGFVGYGVIEPNFSLMAEEKFPAGYRQFCAERKIGVISYYGLAAGFLTGKYRKPEDIKGGSREQWLGGYFNARGDAVLAALDQIAAETGATVPQVAIAWIIATPGVTAPIASATSVAQVEGLLPALTLTLSAEQKAALDAAAATPV